MNPTLPNAHKLLALIHGFHLSQKAKHFPPVSRRASKSPNFSWFDKQTTDALPGWLAD